MNTVTPAHTKQSLVADLTRLGVVEGDILFVHASFKSLGPVEGGAATVVAALEEAIGSGGTLLMPSFNLVEDREGTWNPATSPSTVGWLSEYFRRMEGTLRSDHYSHAVAGRGRLAREIVTDHRNPKGMSSPWDKEPWGRTFGEGSPMVRAMNAGAKIMMLGVTYKSSTYMHLIEVTHWNRRLPFDPKAEYAWINRNALGAYWDSLNRQSRGRVGDADCRLADARDFVNTLLAAARERPLEFYKYWPVGQQP